MAINLYQVLKVRCDASDSEIKAALAQAEHDGIIDQSVINAARQALLNPHLREKYNERLNAQNTPRTGSSASNAENEKTEVKQTETPISVRFMTVRFNRNVAIALIIGLIIGYFAGREHLKYQFKSALVDGFAEAFSSSKTDKPAPEKERKKSPISALFLDKGFMEYEYNSYLTVNIQFVNNGKKDIRAFNGELIFKDILGNELLKSPVRITDPLPADSILPWRGSINYNQYKSNHREFNAEDKKNIKFELSVRKILYKDNTEEEF